MNGNDFQEEDSLWHLTGKVYRFSQYKLAVSDGGQSQGQSSQEIQISIILLLGLFTRI
jgi:hypothetical protein